jgi:hypothetical protein
MISAIRLCIVSILFIAYSTTQGQEFEYSIKISTPQIQKVDPRVFVTLESNLTDFLNSRVWTNERYEPNERIKVNVQMVMKRELSETAFDFELTIQASRPVYGTTYETIIFNHVDRDFSFSFDEGRPLVYADNIFSENLTQVFAFYSFYILGLDHDSFAPYGGDPYFQTAQEIVAAVPSGDSFARGWRANDGNRSRYRLSENIMNPRLRPFRKAFYDYHRLGLDLMHKDPVAGKTSIMNSLTEMETANKAEPNTAILQVFAASKGSELVDIFLPMPSEEKQAVYKIMTGIDPTSASRMGELRR